MAVVPFLAISTLINAMQQATHDEKLLKHILLSQISHHYRQNNCIFVYIY